MSNTAIPMGIQNTDRKYTIIVKQKETNSLISSELIKRITMTISKYVFILPIIINYEYKANTNYFTNHNSWLSLLFL